MGKINVLDFEIANLIAAGEVVERPSSVMKELIENSIDSGATKIVAEIKRGGVAMIRVTDNGSGMDAQDLPVALKRHATSKIQSREDLDGIMTLGFRGEALAAISAVSSVTIISKTKDAEVGSMLTSEGGRVIDVSEVGTADGTTVVVENLFYNVPARRKFLKKDVTEAMNVTALVEKVALSRPDISIQLLVDGNEKFRTPGDGDLYNTIHAIFGKDFAQKMIKADGTANGIRAWGYIGRSDNTRKNRNLQNVFINGRYVKSLTAMAAIEKAYTSYIAPEAFPTCVLFLEMNPMMVDVNVHPAKLEVKFANEQMVFESVYYTVKRAIEDFEYRPEMNLEKKTKGDFNPLSAFVALGEDTKGKQLSFGISAINKLHGTTPMHNTNVHSGDSKTKVIRDNALDRPVGVASRANPLSATANTVTPKSSLEILEKYNTSKVGQEYAPSAPASTILTSNDEEKEHEYKYIGELFDCYVILEYDNALLVIDKHAAHERVIFEDLKEKCNRDGCVATQSMMLPITVLLTPDEAAVALEYQNALEAVGFEYSTFEDHADIISIPNAISAASAETLFSEMIDELLTGRGNPEITDNLRKERALYQVACKAAIKGGRQYDRVLIDWLIDKVLSMPDIIVCPHGRPIAFKLTKNELDRQFDRIK